MHKIAVLISGNGSNFKAIIDSKFDINVGCVISNKAEAKGLSYAHEQSIPAYIVPHNEYDSKEEFESQLIKIITEHDCELVILAGFMRVLTPLFVNQFANRIINIHPSLLPAFVGMNTKQRAIEAGVKMTGSTVHLVNNELDSGAIIMQGVTAITPDDTIKSLQAKIQQLEHRMYPFAIYKLINQQYTTRHNNVFLTHLDDDIEYIQNNNQQAFYY